ncbi:MAG: hypothetical protein ACI9FG_001945 [Crocinitomicaceae bacterium]|jgi:hypothetical protein
MRWRKKQKLNNLAQLATLLIRKMSWLKENYEKAALGGAVAILVAVVATKFVGEGGELSDKALRVDIDNSPGEELLTEMALVLEARESPAEIRPKLVDGREVDLFVGQPLYMADGSVDPVEIIGGPNVHKGIANDLWVKYGIDPSFANAPERDQDKDGFTNREEFDAETAPTDKTSYPSPLIKLKGESVDVFKIQMRWSSFDPKSITLYYQDTKPTRTFSERVKHGASFIAKEGMEPNNRFKLSDGSTKKEGPNGRVQDAYEVEDTTPRYKGTPKQFFTLFRQGPKAGRFNEIQDRSVTLTLYALGQEGTSFVVNELERFSLPYDEKARNRPYQVTKIEPIAGQADVFAVEIIEVIDGETETKTLTVRKGK